MKDDEDAGQRLSDPAGIPSSDCASDSMLATPPPSRDVSPAGAASRDYMPLKSHPKDEMPRWSPPVSPVVVDTKTLAYGSRDLGQLSKRTPLHRGSMMTLSVDSGSFAEHAVTPEDASPRMTTSGPLRQPHTRQMRRPGVPSQCTSEGDEVGRVRQHERGRSGGPPGLCTIDDACASRAAAPRAIETASYFGARVVRCEDSEDDDTPTISASGSGTKIFRALSVDSGMASIESGNRSASQRFRSRRGSHERQLLRRARARLVDVPEVPAGVEAGGGGQPADAAGSNEGAPPLLEVVARGELPHADSV